MCSVRACLATVLQLRAVRELLFVYTCPQSGVGVPAFRYIPYPQTRRGVDVLRWTRASAQHRPAHARRARPAPPARGTTRTLCYTQHQSATRHIHQRAHQQTQMRAAAPRTPIAAARSRYPLALSPAPIRAHHTRVTNHCILSFAPAVAGPRRVPRPRHKQMPMCTRRHRSSRSTRRLPPRSARPARGRRSHSTLPPTPCRPRALSGG